MNDEEVRASGLVLGKIIDILATDVSLTDTATLVCSGKTIDCRKSVLQIASDVFMTMLTAPMKEKTTGVVEMDDVSGDMMQLVVDFYETGLLPDVSNIVHEDLQYIITKYNFVGIKEAVADKILKGASDSGEHDLYESVITFYGNAAQKNSAMLQIAYLFLSGKNYPTFVLSLKLQEFMKLLRISQSHVRSFVGQPKETPSETETRATVQILSVFRDWLNTDPDSRSESFIALLNLIDMRGLDWDYILKNVVTLPLKKEYQVILGMLKASQQSAYNREVIITREVWKIECCRNKPRMCTECQHEVVPPFHKTSGCLGKHQCGGCSTSYRLEFIPKLCWEKAFASLSAPMDTT